MRRDHHTRSQTADDNSRRYKIANQIRRDTRLTSWARLVYAELDDLAGAEKDSAYPKQATLAKTLGASLRTIKRALCLLRRYGIVQVIETKQTYSRYRLAARNPGPQLVKRPAPSEHDLAPAGEAIAAPAHNAAPWIAPLDDAIIRRHRAHGPELPCYEEYGSSDQSIAVHRWRCRCGWVSQWYHIKMPLPAIAPGKGSK